MTSWQERKLMMRMDNELLILLVIGAVLIVCEIVIGVVSG